MTSPAHQLIEQQQQLVSKLRTQLETAESHAASECDSEPRAKLMEAETELRGMNRVFQAVFGSGSGPR